MSTLVPEPWSFVGEIRGGSFLISLLGLPERIRNSRCESIVRGADVGLTIGNITIGKKTGGPESREARYWDEEDPRARYNALSDACWIYRYRDLEQNLRRSGWRQARKRVLAHGALSGEWVSRGGGDVRLGRGGLEMRFRSGRQSIGWKKMREMILARRS